MDLMDNIVKDLDLVQSSKSCDEKDGSISPLIHYSVAQFTAFFEKKTNFDDLPANKRISKSSTLPRRQLCFNEEDYFKESKPSEQDNKGCQNRRLQYPILVKQPRSRTVESSKTTDCKPLLLAAREGNLEVVRWLVDRGIDTNIKDSKGRSALLVAACADKLGVFKYLLQISDVYEKDLNGWNALHIGVVAGHQRIIEEAINHISIDSRSARGFTALCLAANQGYLNMVEYLLKEGADVNIASVDGWTPLHFAARNRHHLILYVLLSSGKCESILNVRNSEGMTPLSLAVQSGSLDCVRSLLDSGADPNSKDNKGWTPARLAALSNFRDIAQYLANYKAVL